MTESKQLQKNKYSLCWYYLEVEGKNVYINARQSQLTLHKTIEHYSELDIKRVIASKLKKLQIDDIYLIAAYKTVPVRGFDFNNCRSYS